MEKTWISRGSCIWFIWHLFNHALQRSWLCKEIRLLKYYHYSKAKHLYFWVAYSFSYSLYKAYFTGLKAYTRKNHIKNKKCIPGEQLTSQDIYKINRYYYEECQARGRAGRGLYLLKINVFQWNKLYTYDIDISFSYVGNSCRDSPQYRGTGYFFVSQ